MTVVGGDEGATVSTWHFDRVRLKREEGEWRGERGLAAIGDGEKTLRMTRSWFGLDFLNLKIVMIADLIVMIADLSSPTFRREEGKKPPEPMGPKHGKVFSFSTARGFILCS